MSQEDSIIANPDELEQHLTSLNSDSDENSNDTNESSESNEEVTDSDKLYTPTDSDLSEQPAPLNLLYLPLVLRFLLVWVFGIKLVFAAIAGYGAYQTPTVKSIGVFLAVVYGGLFGVWQLLSVLLGFTVLKIVERWEHVKLMGEIFLMTNKFAKSAHGWVADLVYKTNAKYKSLSDSVYESPGVIKGLTVVNKLFNNSMVRKLLTVTDSLIAKLVDLVSLLLSKMSSSFTPSVTTPNINEASSSDMSPDTDSETNNVKHDNADENSDKVQLVEDDSTSSSEGGELKSSTAPPKHRFNNSSEFESDAIKSIQSLLSEFPPSALDLSNLPEPPKNSAEMKQQMDMMINLMQQTQKLAEMSEKFNKSSGRRKNKHF